jgi:hypothetical protein
MFGDDPIDGTPQQAGYGHVGLGGYFFQEAKLFSGQIDRGLDSAFSFSGLGFHSGRLS